MAGSVDARKSKTHSRTRKGKDSGLVFLVFLEIIRSFESLFADLVAVNGRLFPFVISFETSNVSKEI